MIQRKYGFTVEVDIHGMYATDAKKELLKLISSCGKDVHEIVVIHGFHGGVALQNMVRKELKSDKIARKILSMNNGQTTLVLK